MQQVNEGLPLLHARLPVPPAEVPGGGGGSVSSLGRAAPLSPPPSRGKGRLLPEGQPQVPQGLPGGDVAGLQGLPALGEAVG